MLDLLLEVLSICIRQLNVNTEKTNLKDEDRKIFIDILNVLRNIEKILKGVCNMKNDKGSLIS